MLYVLVALAIFGHWALCIYAINRLHATALPHRFMKVVDLIWYVLLFVLPVAAAAAVLADPSAGWRILSPAAVSQAGWRALLLVYASVCWMVAPLAIRAWIGHRRSAIATPRLESNHTTRINVSRHLGRMPSASLATSLLARLPGNQVFDLWIHDKSLRLPRLPSALDGLRISHLSDLHLTGRVAKEFFELVVDQTNSLESDLIVITGDIIDKRRCFPWLADVLGQLKARYGVYFVLGNHDLRIRDELGLRTELARLGLTDLGGRCHKIDVHGQPVLLAGNELPWFAPAADMNAVRMSASTERPFRIAVAHSPDQFEWARHHDFDLLLAGHTHGGQIRFPVIGPVFSPSQHGVRYAAGTFYQEPTLMHVSRGLSGTRPLRFNCPPELARLILRSEMSSVPV
jgi:predicted MPP superfamily phosphohydrolase